MTIEIPKGYETLGEALAAAVEQAAVGKGAGRHSYGGELFSDQLIFEIPRRLGACGSGFLLGQAVKKIYESVRLEPERARAELLGAVNYLAAAWSRQGGEEGVMQKWASRQIANNGVVSAPEPPKASGNVCLEFSERVVSLMKELGLHEVSFAGPGARICADGVVTGLHFTTAIPDGSGLKDAEALCRRIREVNPAVYPQEDADMPRFQKGELVEYRSDGTWKPAAFMYMDGGYAVLVSGGEEVEVLAFNVRPAESVSAPEDFQFDEDRMAESMPGIVPSAAPLFPERTPVECRPPLEPEWTPAFYIGVDAAGFHIVERDGLRLHLSADAVRKPEKS